METKYTDWHQADIIAGLRKKGTSLAAESRKKWLEFLHPRQCTDPTLAEGRVDYCPGAGYRSLGYMAFALPRSHHARVS